MADYSSTTEIPCELIITCNPQSLYRIVWSAFRLTNHLIIKHIFFYMDHKAIIAFLWFCDFCLFVFVKNLAEIKTQCPKRKLYGWRIINPTRHCPLLCWVHTKTRMDHLIRDLYTFAIVLRALHNYLILFPVRPLGGDRVSDTLGRLSPGWGTQNQDLGYRTRRRCNLRERVLSETLFPSCFIS